MYELRSIALVCGLWLLSCAGGPGEKRPEAERSRVSVLERQRGGAERGRSDVVSGSGRGEGSPGGSEPGTLGSNTNWRPIEPTRPLPIDSAEVELADVEPAELEDIAADEGGDEGTPPEHWGGEADPAAGSAPSSNGSSSNGSSSGSSSNGSSGGEPGEAR